MPTRLSVATICAMLALAFGASLVGSGPVTAAQQSAAAHETTQPPPSNMQAMMKMHEQMMADMKSGEAKLDALVKEMNSAAGEAKVTAVAAVVNELVQQHKAMHGRMGQMHQQLMGGRGRMMRP